LISVSLMIMMMWLKTLNSITEYAM
jgi:hypothetical protein